MPSTPRSGPRRPRCSCLATRRRAGHNTQIIGGDDALDQLAGLRAQGDGDIGVGGAALATQPLRAHLLDLLEQRSFDGGVTMHRYAVRGARATEPGADGAGRAGHDV